MKKSARVSEKMVSPGLPGLQVATRLLTIKFGDERCVGTLSKLNCASVTVPHAQAYRAKFLHSA